MVTLSAYRRSARIYLAEQLYEHNPRDGRLLQSGTAFDEAMGYYGWVSEVVQST
jgi:hypothetical protein